MKKVLGVAAILSVLMGGSVFTFAAENEDTKKRVTDIMAMKHRDAEDRTRDSNRAPARAMSFWGIKPDMRVIEFGPGGGWYTKILAPFLKDNGELYLVSKQEWLDRLDPILKSKPVRKAKKQAIPLDWSNESHSYVIDTESFGLDNVDMVLNIREYHSFTAEGKKKLNKATFDALKPGGTYVVIDHTRRHMQAEDAELGRREDPVQVILDVQAAGFILDKSSDMFLRLDDELRYEVGRKTVTGNTDRFTLVFRKPL